MNSAERESRMMTAESATRMDTSSPDYAGTETKKPSLLKKVKAKAKKLRSKLKPGHHEPENPNTPPVDNENTISSSSSGEEDEGAHELGYTPLSKSVNPDDDKRTAHAEERDFGDFGKQSDESGVNLGGGQTIPEEDPSAPKTGSDSVPLSQLKSPGPAGVEQAVPTSYNYFNQDPTDAYKTPSPAALGIGEGKTPSAAGEESTGAVSDSRSSGSDIYGAGDKPSGEFPSESRGLGSDVSGAADEPFSTGWSGSLQDDTSNTAPAADRSPEEDRDAKIPVGILAPGSTDTDSRQGRGDDDSFSSGRNYEQDVGMENPVKKVTDSLSFGSTDDQNSTDDSPSTDNYSAEDQKPIHQRAYEGLTGGMGQRLGAYRDYDHAPGDETTTSSSEPTMAQRAYDSIVGTKDAAAEKLSQNITQQSEPSVTQKAYDTLAGVTGATANKLGVQSGTATDSSSASGPGGNSFFNSAAAPVSEFNSSESTESKPVTQKVSETATTWKDSIASILEFDGTTTGITPRSDADQTASESTAVSGDQKPLTQKVTQAGAGLKETVASRLGYEGSSTNTPGEEMVRNTRETVAEKGREVDVGLSSDSTPVSQKAADTAYRAKDSTVSTLTPTEDDKAFSQNVTETISNLPTLLTEKLGFGGASTTTKDFQGPSKLDVPVSSSPSQISSGADTPDSAAAGIPTNAPAASSPGIVDRVTGAMSSLFGGAKKLSAGTGGEYSPTVSPSGAGRRDALDTSPMVTDVDGGSTPRSSPAA